MLHPAKQHGDVLNEEARSGLQNSFERKKILLADDQQMLRLLVRTTIEDDTYELLEANDGDEALAIVKRERPDLVLLDVHMPGRNGFDVCREIKTDADTASTKVIMLTASSLESDYLQGINAGADLYFTKPFSPLDLLRKLRELLGP